MLSPTIESEIATLADHYGAPRRVAVALEGAPFRPLSATDRIGEVCMVVRRPNNRLLTAVKTFYPPGAFRLLTGGVDHGERIEAALLREAAEETGLDVVVRRFLAVIEYQLVGDRGQGDTETGRQGDRESKIEDRGSRIDDLPSSILDPRSSVDARSPTPDPRSPFSHSFVTFAFLLDEIGGTLGAQDATEQIGAFREVEVAELPAVADTLERSPDAFHPEVVGSWRDWGRFRAVVHRVVYDTLKT